MHASRFVASYFDAWNHRDPQAIAAHLADDGLYCDVPENVERNRDELIVNLNEFFATHRQRYELIGDIVTGPGTIAFQYQVCPRDSERNIKLSEVSRGAEFITLDGDSALSIIDYYDNPQGGRPAKLATATNVTRPTQKYAKSGLSVEQLSEYKNRLARAMHDEQAYLRSDLTLPKLALLIDCSVNHLSQVINAGFGMSFFDYLSQHRVAHAKSLLAKLDGQGDVVLDVAFTVGFNSNSAFYAAFKKCVGQTPAQFRRSQQRKSH